MFTTQRNWELDLWRIRFLAGRESSDGTGGIPASSRQKQNSPGNLRHCSSHPKWSEGQSCSHGCRQDHTKIPVAEILSNDFNVSATGRLLAALLRHRRSRKEAQEAWNATSVHVEPAMITRWKDLQTSENRDRTRQSIITVLGLTGDDIVAFDAIGINLELTLLDTFLAAAARNKAFRKISGQELEYPAQT